MKIPSHHIQSDQDMSDTLMTQGIGSVAAFTDLRQTVIFCETIYWVFVL